MSAIDSSSAIVMSGRDSTGVGRTSTKYYTTPNELLIVNNGNNVSKIYHQMRTLETAFDEDGDSEMTQATRKAVIRQVNSVDLIMAKLNVLSLEDKRKLKESDSEHFETFKAHRPYARPYAKRMKVFNNYKLCQ